MKAILNQSAAVLALVALAAPLAGQERERRTGGLQPLDAGEMETAIVPLEKPPEEGTQAYERWLEEQRHRFQETPISTATRGATARPRAQPLSAAVSRQPDRPDA